MEVRFGFGLDLDVTLISNQVRLLRSVYLNLSEVQSLDDSRIRTKDDIFSIGRKNVTSMIVNDDKLIAACSDGTIRLFDLETVVT